MNIDVLLRDTTGSQSPRSDSGSGSRFIFAPGGQVSIVDDNTNNTPQPDVIPPNQVSQSVQSTAPPTSVGQPPQVTFPAQAPISHPVDASATEISTSLATPITSSMIAPLSLTATSTSFIKVSSTVTSFLVPMTTSVSISASPSTSTGTLSSGSSSSGATSAAVIAVSATASESSQIPSPSGSPTSSNNGHGPPFYIGIVLGTVVIIACLAALIAWWVRLRTHVRRRSADGLDVPWAKPGSNDEGLEKGRDTAFIGSRHLTVDTSIQDISSQDAGVHMQAWEPRGDRDVGEPKRMETPISPYRQPSPAHDPFLDQSQYPSLADSIAYPLPVPNSSNWTSQYLPPQLNDNERGSIDPNGSMTTLGPLHIANPMPGDASTLSSRAPTVLGVNTRSDEFGTPREAIAGARPRFLGLNGEGLYVPWAHGSASRQRGMSFRSKREKSSDGRWERLSMSREPLTTAKTIEREGWTDSVKSNLINAFNAVAASLPSGPTMEEKQESYLTSAPTRKSLRREDWRNFSSGEVTGNPLTRKSTTTSTTWSLEETADGSGIVRFHGRGLESYGGGDHVFSPQPSESSLALQGGTADFYCLTACDSQTPLILKPKAALLQPDIYGRLSQYNRRTKSRLGTGMISRASSIYSIASGTSSMCPDTRSPLPQPPCIPAFSRHSTMTMGALNLGLKKDGVANEPERISRLSSFSGHSFALYGTYGAGMMGSEEAVHRAIIDRTKRLKEAV